MKEGIKNVDKNAAFILELVGGFFGVLGLGYFYSNQITEGIMRLVAWMVIMAVGWTLVAILTAFVIGLCCIPFMIILQILVPVWSAVDLKGRLDMAYPGQ